MALNTKPNKANIFGNETTNDYLLGTTSNDTLSGGGETINYVSNNDINSLLGFFGDDVYVVNNSNDVIVEFAGEGTDTIYSTVDYSLPIEVENIASSGTTGVVLTGNNQNNILDGLQNTGSDTLIGMNGDDNYFIDGKDKIIEGTGTSYKTNPGGVDTIITANAINISANNLNIIGALFIENIVLTGASDVDAVGNILNNRLVGNTGSNNLSGNAGNDVLDGGAGVDTLIGGAGDDTYYIDNKSDSIFETQKAGNDWVLASISWTLGNELENILLTGSIAIKGEGNEKDNVITGNAIANILTGNNGNDTFDGGAGNDTLSGGLGNDVYIVDSTDNIVEASGEGIDTVQTTVNWILGNELENITLTGMIATSGTGNILNNIIIGNTIANNLIGNDGNDTLNGGDGNDTLSGGLGDDFYVVDAIDNIVEIANAGVDTVLSAVNWTLGDQLENLTLTGKAIINGTGNVLNNVILGNVSANILTGNNGNDTLDGGAGKDTLLGGLGDDVYIVDSTDNIVEASGEGIDTVQTTVNWILDNEIENLVLKGNAAKGTGNALENVLVGNAMANNMSGGSGDDTITGGAGKDIVSVGDGNDIVIFAAGTTDTIAATKSIANVDLYNDLTLNGALADRLELSVAVANVGTAVSGYLSESTFVTTMNALLNTGDGRGFATNITGTTTAAIATATSGNLVGRNFLVVDLDGSDTFTTSDFVIEITGSTVTALTTGSFVGSTLTTNHAPVGNVTITGNAIKGQILTASNTLTDADNLGTVSYLWQSNGVNLGTGSSYTLTSNEIGKTIVAIASYTDGLGKAESMNSAATIAVTDAPVPGTAGVSIVGSDFITSEAGDTAVFNVKLNSAPTRDVTIDFTSSDPTEGVITNSTLKFTSANWSTPQTFTVTGQNDSLVDGAIAYTITAKITTLDIFYKSVTPDSLTLTNQDTPIAKVETINGTNNMDILQGTLAPSYILGEAGDDDLSGGAGNDTIYGSYGNDLLFGEDGNDKLYGENDADYMDGGAGNDSLDGGLSGLDTLIGGAGNDTYYLGYDEIDVIDDQGLATDIDTVIMPYQLSSYTLPTGIEQGTIAPGTGASNLTGNEGDNILTGNDGSNMLIGAVGRDSLFGGAGADTLEGGIGEDTFTFNTALTANVDTITDFNVADDTIQLDHAIFTKLTAIGILDSSMFVTGAAANDSNDYLVYNNATGALSYDADGNGTGAAIQIAMIGSNLALTAADFVVI